MIWVHSLISNPSVGDIEDAQRDRTPLGLWALFPVILTSVLKNQMCQTFAKRTWWSCFLVIGANGLQTGDQNTVFHNWIFSPKEIALINFQSRWHNSRGRNVQKTTIPPTSQGRLSFFQRYCFLWVKLKYIFLQISQLLHWKPILGRVSQSRKWNSGVEKLSYNPAFQLKHSQELCIFQPSLSSEKGKR